MAETVEAEGPDTVWKIRPGRGRKRSITDETVRAIVKDTLENKPEGATHWSLRTMAKRHGVSRSTVQRVWKSYGLKPHRTKTTARSVQFSVAGNRQTLD